MKKRGILSISIPFAAAALLTATACGTTPTPPPDTVPVESSTSQAETGVSSAATSGTSSTTSVDSNERITDSKALELAMARAGVTGEVSVLHNYIDNDDAIQHYEVSFVQNGIKYDVDVQASNGNILDFDQEPAEPGEMPANETNRPTAAEQLISRDDAIARARAAIGISGGRVEDSELEYDNGSPQYDVVIQDGYTEYEVIVDAKTGRILYQHSERDD